MTITPAGAAPRPFAGPDGTVDGADLAVLLGSWGDCRDRECEGEPSLMGGGGGSNPFEGTEIGDLLDALLGEEDEEAAAELAAQLFELLSE